jgi:2-polyprenyl-6-methoxyphenol hydroxylase-like FAD-dependent oxidoreductase
MVQAIGQRAIVIGAGFAGLSAARALAPFFEQVNVIERDALPNQARARAGVAQGRQGHALLAGGCRALEQLMSGYCARLSAAGAHEIVVNQDLCLEQPGFDPFPRRDLGISVYSATRPLLEQVLREAVTEDARVQLEPELRVRALACDGGRVTGVHCESKRGTPQLMAADLTLDASGTGELTLDALKALELPDPEVTSIGLNIGYATAQFEIPAGGLSDWKICNTFPKLPQSTRGALMLPVEGNCWQLSLGSLMTEEPPATTSDFIQAVQGLRTQTIAKALGGGQPVTEIARFGFNGSRHRHYERLAQFPCGLLVLGDALCRFNPVHGQGMSVAAQEGLALRELLEARRALPDPLDGLAPEFFARCAQLIATPWENAALPDLILPGTVGVRPPDLRARLKASFAIHMLAAQDPDVHRLQMEVMHLLKPHRAYFEGEVGARVQAHVARLN